MLESETPPAYRAALAILRSPEEAQDVVQEAAIRAWQKLPGLRSGLAWPAWFRRTVVRVALDEQRHARHVREIRLSDLTPYQDPLLDGTDDDLDLLDAFGRLPADERALLALRFWLDLTVLDVAAALGIRVGTAKARIHRAIARLRTELRDDH